MARLPSPSRMRRLPAFIVAVLLALWLAVLISGYIGGGWSTRSYRPEPERIASIVALAEASPAAPRNRLMRAIDTPTFRASIATKAAPSALCDTMADENLMRYFAPALSGRSFTAADMDLYPKDTPHTQFRWHSRRAVVLCVGLDSGETLVLQSSSPAILTYFGMPLGVGAGAAGTIIAMLALWVLWREVRPLSELARVAETIDLNGGKVTLPDTQGQSHEIISLSHALGRLQNRLAAVLQARMALIGGISHDLRTLATRLRLRIEGIEDPSQKSKAVSEIEDMMHLLDNALLAVQGNALSSRQELIDLSELAQITVEDLETQGLLVSMLPAPAAYVLGERLALRRVLENLIVNAIRYGRRARVSVATTPTTVMVCIADEGPGIAPDKREIILEPFVRGETSRNPTTGGYGLGLAIARNLIEAQGGSLSLDPSCNSGATVAIVMPSITVAFCV